MGHVRPSPQATSLLTDFKDCEGNSCPAAHDIALTEAPFRTAHQFTCSRCERTTVPLRTDNSRGQLRYSDQPTDDAAAPPGEGLQRQLSHPHNNVSIHLPGMQIAHGTVTVQ